MQPQAQRSTQGWLRLATELRTSRRWSELNEAIEAARNAASHAQDFALLGEFLGRLERYEEACAAYDRALGIDTDNPRYLFNRATVRRYVGRIEDAESDYDRVIATDPADVEAWCNRSELRRQTLERNHLEALLKRLRAGFAVALDEVPIRYALAKEYEDIGRYADSWAHLAAGAAIRRRHLKYDVRHDVQTVSWIMQTFSAVPLAADGCPSTEPIFILGMPRTGSTLLERIMSGNTAVFAAGELIDFAAALVHAVHHKLGRRQISRRELVAASAAVDGTALGAAYLERTRPRTGHTPHFIDKMPLNYLYGAIIRAALPNAPLLHLTRHPMATCYAVFKTLFNQGYPFSYDLSEVAEYYIGYHQLMAHWRRVIPERILDVSYEKLVTAPALEARRVFDHCGLEWHDRCLDIAQRGTASTTASAAQVRGPIYSTSVDLWRQYAGPLAPVAERLRRAGIEVA
ncbi:MAG TPA: sulfotransferase [Steroidobacteraceae bacterium]|nr:sulfotransferase [Steroidobacteraceae bacterium]